MGTHLPAREASACLPPRKPMLSVRRVSLFEREIRVGLSSAAIEILFDLASVLSEGAREPDGYFGSTMITIELARAAALVSDPCDATTVRRLAELLVSDARVRERARALAAAEADRLAGAPLVGTQLDLRVRESGRHLHIDVELEARWAPAETAQADPSPVRPGDWATAEAAAQAAASPRPLDDWEGEAAVPVLPPAAAGWAGRPTAPRGEGSQGIRPRSRPQGAPAKDTGGS